MLKDFLFLPKKTYEKFTDKPLWLYLGMFCIGVLSLYAFFYNRAGKYFLEPSIAVIAYNILIAALLAALLGFLEVYLISVPIFDFVMMKKDDHIKNNSMLTKLGKVYVCTYIPNILYFIAVYIILRPSVIQIEQWSLYLEIAYYVVWFWQAGIMTRGAGVLFSLQGKKKGFVFVMALVWIDIISWALTWGMDKFIITLFRT